MCVCGNPTAISVEVVTEEIEEEVLAGQECWCCGSLCKVARRASIEDEAVNWKLMR